MSTLNLQINAVSFDDLTASNNPIIRVFDLAYKKLGQPCNLPRAERFLIPPGVTQDIFSGTRVTAIDNTSLFTVTRPDPVNNTYRFTNVGGTSPVFRTKRIINIDNTTNFSISVNGPISTYTYVSGTALDTSSVVVGDILKIESGSGVSTSNIGRFTILSKTATSISVMNLNASIESAQISDFTKFLIYSNGNNNQIQIGDQVIISAGFSAATFGTYQIQEVTPDYFEVLIASPNGIPLESSIAPTSSGLIFYKSAKKFILIAAEDKCSVLMNGNSSDSCLLEPKSAQNPEQPALFIKDGTTYSLSIKNLSLQPLSVVVASAE